jgi:hypothetical protein
MKALRFVPWASVPAAKPDTSGVWFIYALVDPRDERVRYVGVTDKPLADRLRGHLRKPTNAGMREWLSGISASGLLPSIRLLSAPLNQWEQAEQGWISWFRSRGSLLNVDPGGLARRKNGKLKGWARRLNKKAEKDARRRVAKERRRRPGKLRPVDRATELAQIESFIASKS